MDINHGHVTQPLIWEELVDFGVDISKGQVSRILTEQKEDFHLEKEGVLCAGLDISSYINVDDTGARHAGKNGYCTHIGNDLFAWFESTASKSRINFLELLRQGNRDYVINAEALEYIQRQSFPQPLLALLATDPEKHFHCSLLTPRSILRPKKTGRSIWSNWRSLKIAMCVSPPKVPCWAAFCITVFPKSW